MTQDQLYSATANFKKEIANGYESPTKEVDVQITNTGIKLVYTGFYRTYTAIVDEKEEKLFRDFNVIKNYDNWGFAPEDND